VSDGRQQVVWPIAREGWETRALKIEGPTRWSGLRVKREERQIRSCGSPERLFRSLLRLGILGFGEECRQDVDHSRW